jgi:DNA polymerase V
MARQKYYICIDLKSFYASVECIDRGLDPFVDNLVVADPTRTEKTICLAITPSMKALGVKNRCRVFEIPASIDYIMAPPRMRRYMEVSSAIYAIYLRYVSPQDVHVYSIDECFIDVTPYLTLYDTTPREFAKTLMAAVLSDTGICATAGVGTNLFLAKVALDVTAKHAPDNIGYLDEAAYRREIWFHRPITDIWNVGAGTARRLAKYGVYDMGGVCGMHEETLYKEFGVNAQYLIDHAWGQEPCTIAEIQAYEPQGHSMSNGQVLPCNYTFDEALDVVREMTDASVLEMVEAGLVCERVSVAIGYARIDGVIPQTGASKKLSRKTNSGKFLMNEIVAIYKRTTRHDMPIRRINLGFCDLAPEEQATLTLFDDVEAMGKERKLQQALVDVRSKFGKNAMLKGVSLKEKATARERNQQVGGHRA